MVPLTQTATRQRSERRIAVRLPLRVRGRDSRGVIFEEETSSENLCRSGAAFLTRFDVAIGSDLEIRIPFSHYASRRTEADFSTSGRVVHVVDCQWARRAPSRRAIHRPPLPARLPLRKRRVTFSSVARPFRRMLGASVTHPSFLFFEMSALEDAPLSES